MSVPGSNLLSAAFDLICADSLPLYRYEGKTLNSIGYDVRTYSRPVTISGSVQAVDRNFYTAQGLDFSKRYVQVWTESNVDDIYRGRSGDQITWNGNRWEIMGENNWHPIDGWNSFLAVQVPTP